MKLKTYQTEQFRTRFYYRDSSLIKIINSFDKTRIKRSMNFQIKAVIDQKGSKPWAIQGHCMSRRQSICHK